MESGFILGHGMQMPIAILVVLLLLSAFFSGSETSIMAINPYKLRHNAKKSKRAQRVLSLFEDREKLLSVILIGNNFVNISASSIATIIGLQLLGEKGVLLATVILTAVLLIFGEITPKTLASLKPERYAYITSLPLYILMKILYPLALITNQVAMAVLKIFGFNRAQSVEEGLTEEEMLTLVKTSKNLLSTQHQSMMSNILNLRNISVDDIMIPKTEIHGIDLSSDISNIISQLYNPKHTMIPVYYGDINDIKGILYNKDIPALLKNSNLDKDSILSILRPTYFVPESASLHTQLIQFKLNKSRMGVVVDEYGDIQGIISIDNIIEEIIGELPKALHGTEQQIIKRRDGSLIVDGNINLRKLNNFQKMKFPTENAKTLNGLILEYLDCIPVTATCLEISGYKMEIMQVHDNMVKKVKFYPK